MTKSVVVSGAAPTLGDLKSKIAAAYAYTLEQVALSLSDGTQLSNPKDYPDNKPLSECGVTDQCLVFLIQQ